MGGWSWREWLVGCCGSRVLLFLGLFIWRDLDRNRPLITQCQRAAERHTVRQKKHFIFYTESKLHVRRRSRPLLRPPAIGALLRVGLAFIFIICCCVWKYYKQTAGNWICRPKEVTKSVQHPNNHNLHLVLFCMTMRGRMRWKGCRGITWSEDKSN